MYVFIYAFSIVNMYISSFSVKVTLHPFFSAILVTFSHDVVESKSTSTGKIPLLIAFFTSSTGCGQESPRVSTVSDMKHLR